ncbi:CG30096 [Drosophila busckii]|uniref:CG30096 n=1 Tax=Drosophila busckii TaxID=30019 RepID=A0A0M4ECM2_DROBS|nr:uncharacterized protein LOC108595805 [Drosophila busckii]ALC41502.1 CG30096 [Drosophila busckii]
MSDEGSQTGNTTSKERKTLWYSIEEIGQEGSCPSCGIVTFHLKNVLSHVKRCFSIKKVGPIYRLYGYTECKCGILLANSEKAKKLHHCAGEVPAFEFDMNSLRKSVIPPTFAHKPKNVSREPLQPKPWIRNFVSPLKINVDNMQDSSQPAPYVRNFDICTNKQEPQDVSVYSISSNNGAILVRGMKPSITDTDEIVIKKRALRLPTLKEGKGS